jgi:N-acetylneuraminate synthase/N,N'-diacetyllegionaminate synthase
MDHMVTTFEIAGRRLGGDTPCFVIAEAGVNHNGSVATAKQLVAEAKRCGADCVKFQTFKAERIVTASSPKASYQFRTTDPKESQLEMLRKLELSEAAHREIFAYAQQVGIPCISTPYNLEDIALLKELGVPALKIASGQLVEPYFLRAAAETGLPLIVSTGMADLAEVAVAVDTIRVGGNDRLALLQCTTDYPSRTADANLRVMATFRQAFECVVGYSDHTEGIAVCLGAVALGAQVIEKHFTLDRALPGPDHACSSDPAEFAAFTRGVRDVEAALGRGVKIPSEAERRNTLGMRRSIVAREALKRGTVLAEHHFAFKRPASGLAPSLLPRLVGRKLKADLPADALLSWEAIE